MAATPQLFPPQEVLATRRLASERELIDALRLSRTTLWRLRARGMPTVSVGRSVRYDMERVRRWLDEQGVTAERAVDEGKAHADMLPDCHWQLSVALDPKHRPQEPGRPASTVRREWWRYPQEAHLLDRRDARYRRLNADEVRALQGFPEGWGTQVTKDELLLIRGYGDAVPPLLAERIFSCIDAIHRLSDIKTSVEICAGFGGMALGKSRALAAVRHIALIDRWPVACEVLRSSGLFEPSQVRELDLNEFDWSEFADQVDLLTGGPPCQPWSQAGQGLGEEDERDLLGKMPEVVSVVGPKLFLFENVPGLLSGENEPYARELIERLRHCGGRDSYGVAMGVLNAADFGVAQVRRRVFIVGARGRAIQDIHRFFDKIESTRTHANPRVAGALGLLPWVTLGQAIPDWDKPKTQWHRWPQPSHSSEQMTDSGEPNTTSSVIAQARRQRVRVGLDWPSRGSKVRLSQTAGWEVDAQKDDLLGGAMAPLLPAASAGSPRTSPWYVVGEPMDALEALRRVVGRNAKLVYVDIPRIKTNAGSFDAAERESLLDTWLTVVQGLLRRAYAILRDDGVLAALCGIEETHFVRLLLDDIGGPTNHVGTVAWQKNYSPRNMPGMKEISPIHDNIVIFARRMESLPAVALKVPPDGFVNRDGDPRGPWNAEQKGANKPDCDYEVNICPYRWSLASGELPPGMWRINPKSGVIWAKSGDLKEPGEWTFTVRVIDSHGDTAEKKFKIGVATENLPPGPASIPWLESTGGLDDSGKLRIETKTLPPAKLGSEYSACILAAGGVPWKGTTRPGKTASGGKGRYWEFPLTTLVNRAAFDAVDFKNTDGAIPALKTYLDGATYTTLNQTSLWFGSGKGGVGDVGYSQDAKKELEDLVQIGVISSTVGISKPARLMSRLLALFSSSEAIVVDLGSPAAELASIATAMGRRAIYMQISAVPEETRNGLLRPRLAYAASGKHPLPDVVDFLGSPAGPVSSTSDRYFVDGRPRPSGVADIYEVNVGRRFAELDATTGTAAINYERYPADGREFLNALASLEGLVADPKDESPIFARSMDGMIIAIHVSSNAKLDRQFAIQMSERYSTELQSGRVLRIYYHRGFPPPDSELSHRIDFRRIPFELNFTAGLT